MEYKDFQKRAIRRIVDSYTDQDKNINRVLLSDEVGLGKTIIAKGVIRCLLAKKSIEDPDLKEFKVLYLCSNLNIAAQNQRKLGIKRKGESERSRTVLVTGKISEEEYRNKKNIGVKDRTDENRITMLTAKYYREQTKESITAEQLAKEYKEVYGEDSVYEQLVINREREIILNVLPVTPKTSIKIERQGCKLEREYIRRILKVIYDKKLETNDIPGYDFGFINNNEELIDIFKNELPGNWDGLIDQIEMKGRIDTNFINEFSDGEYFVWQMVWEKLRRIFAQATLKWLKYDIVIMDEFQNFHDILVSANSAEQNRRKRDLKEIAEKAAISGTKEYSEYFDDGDNEEKKKALEWAKGLWFGDKIIIGEIYQRISGDENKRYERQGGMIWVDYTNILSLKFTKIGEEQCLNVYDKDNVELWGEKNGCLRIMGNPDYGFYRNHQKSSSFFDKYKKFQWMYLGNYNYMKKPLDTILALPLYSQDEDFRNVAFNTVIQILCNSGEKFDGVTVVAKRVKNPHLIGRYLSQYFHVLNKLDQKRSERINIEEIEPLRILDSLEEGISDEDMENSENLIIRNIFKNEEKNDGTKVDILMLSATPFRMKFGDGNNGENDQTADFSTVCDFLDYNNILNLGDRLSSYKTKLEKYSKEENVKVDEVIRYKDLFEKAMGRVFSRMERSAVIRVVNKDLFEKGDKKLSISNETDELVSYDIIDFWNYIKDIDKLWRNVEKSLQDNDESVRFAKIIYGENSPYLFSFMNAEKNARGSNESNVDEKVIGYKAKLYFDEQVSAGNISADDCSRLCILRQDYNTRFKKLGVWHGIFKKSLEVVFDLDKIDEDRDDHPGAARLLWIPSSSPTGKFGDVYEKHSDYGKTILFSKYVMVPRMIAGLMSYESERRLLWQICKKCSISPTVDINRFILDLSEKVADRLKNNADTIKKITKDFCHPPVMEYFRHIKAETVSEETIWKYISEPLGRAILNKVFLGNTSGILAVWASETIPKSISDLSLPPNYTDDEVGNIAAAEIVTTKSSILQYCINGRLQDTVSEWLYLCFESDCEIGEFIGIDDKDGEMAQEALSYVKKSSLSVDLYNVDENDHIIPVESSLEDNNDDTEVSSLSKVSVYFARCLGINKDADKISAIANIQKAFNAPFAPFVFATTSIGQEGLDFHLFADRIIHWNLPSNPIDFEQREGRINRYNCLAIRRKVIDWWYEPSEDENSCGNFDRFEKAFSRAREYVSKNTDEKARSGLIPNWILQNKMGDQIAGIKRYVPYFANSRIMEEYHNNLKILQLYRTVIGQSDPVEIMERLMVGKKAKDIANLFVDFSPYNKTTDKSVP